MLFDIYALGRMKGKIMSPNDGIHMHTCPICNRGWDCSNECGEVAESGTVTKMVCGYCIEDPFAEHLSEHQDSVVLNRGVVDEATQEMPHTHVCMVGNHRWIHNDPECGFETMMNPEQMRHLECPACFIFTSPCPQCGHEATEEALLARSDKERAYWCQPCNLIFRCEIKCTE